MHFHVGILLKTFSEKTEVNFTLNLEDNYLTHQHQGLRLFGMLSGDDVAA